MAENNKNNEMGFREVSPEELNQLSGGVGDFRLNFIHLLKCPKCNQIAMKEASVTCAEDSSGRQVITSKTFVCENCRETQVLTSADHVVCYNRIRI